MASHEGNIRVHDGSHVAAWAACLFAGAAMPVAAIAWAASELHLDRVSTRADVTRSTTRSVAVRMLPSTRRDVLADPSPVSDAEPTKASLAARSHRPSPFERDDALPGEVDAVGNARFLAYADVDTAAEPVSSWNITATELDAIATSRLVFTLFVGRDGRIVYCRVDVPERLPADTRRRLADRLSETVMRPAQRGGVPVASHRRVELFTDNGS